MKIREIDRFNYLKNSPLKRVVNISTFILVSLTSAYGGYLIFYNPERLKSKVDFLFGLFNFDKLSDDPAFRIKGTEKRVLSNAFKQYLEEKKAHKSQLDEDTRQRLERLLNKDKAPQAAPEPQAPGVRQSQDDSVKSKRTRLVNYTKSWYRWLTGKQQQQQPPSTTPPAK